VQFASPECRSCQFEDRAQQTPGTTFRNTGAVTASSALVPNRPASLSSAAPARVDISQ